MVSFSHKINFLPWRQSELRQLIKRWFYQMLFFLLLTSLLMLIFCWLQQSNIEKIQVQKRSLDREMQILVLKVKQQTLKKTQKNAENTQQQLLNLLSYLSVSAPDSAHLIEVQQQAVGYLVAGASIDAIGVMQYMQALKDACKQCEIKLVYLNQRKSTIESTFRLQVALGES